MGSERIRTRVPLFVALALVALATPRPVAAAPEQVAPSAPVAAGPEQPEPQQVPQDDSPVTALPDVTVSAPEPRYVAPTTRDRIGRIWAPVLINGQGPFRLVLDTGASSSAVTSRVAEELRLPVYVGSVNLRGVTGSAVSSSIKADTLEVGDLLVKGTTMPIVADAFGGADGVLGSEGLADKRLVIEFRKDRISIARSHHESPPPGFSTVPFKFNRYRGMRVDVLVGSVKATAVIDTGAQVSVGNLALREALARRRGKSDDLQEAIIGITEDIQHATRVQIPAITAGSLLVRNVNIMFADLYIFDHWKLSSTPTILIGMDVLGVLDTLIIDYRRKELQIRTRR